MDLNLRTMAAFGVAGNFTGHLEQAGEAADFRTLRTADEAAPKALFPTFIPADGTPEGSAVPAFLRTFPFSSEKIIFPAGESRLQIEPECAVIFDAEWKDGTLRSLLPVAFGASDDCSIRKEGAKKISLKKNWGACSKGFSAHAIPLNSFSAGGVLDRYRITSFLVRKNEVFLYGEDSAVRDYSYVYERLCAWLIDRLNAQKNEGPAEDIHSYLAAAGFPSRLFISIGATRYTQFGMTNFLQNGDKAVVVLYPEDTYSGAEIALRVKENRLNEPDISALVQTVVC